MEVMMSCEEDKVAYSYILKYLELPSLTTGRSLLLRQ